MKIKKFKAKDIQSAMNQIRKDMGADAVILSTKRINPKKEGTGSNKHSSENVEITAATDAAYTEAERSSLTNIEKPSNMHNNAFPEPVATIKEEIKDLKSVIRNLSIDISQNNIILEDGFKKQINNEYLVKIYNLLTYNECNKNFTFQLIKKLHQQLKSNDLEKFDRLKELTVKALQKVIKVSGLINNDKKDCKTAAFIGPTGGGKTTTLAKLGTYFAVKKKMDIALITLDTYRVGAIDQLKMYADILNVPLSVAFSKEEFKNILDKNSHKDLILIDTTGRNYKDKKHMDELADYFNIDFSISKHLLLSTGYSDRSMKNTIQNFMGLSPDSLIFSKIDESVSFGNIINNSLRFNIPVSYLTNGQVVPDDIEKATTKRIVELVL